MVPGTRALHSGWDRLSCRRKSPITSQARPWLVTIDLQSCLSSAACSGAFWHMRIAPAWCGIIDLRNCRSVIATCWRISTKKPNHRDDACGGDRGVEPLVLVHASHQEQLNQHHRRGHETGHVNLVETAEDIRKRIHHRIHEHVHRDERKQRHPKQTQVIIAMHLTHPPKSPNLPFGLLRLRPTDRRRPQRPRPGADELMRNGAAPQITRSSVIMPVAI